MWVVIFHKFVHTLTCLHVYGKENYRHNFAKQTELPKWWMCMSCMFTWVWWMCPWKGKNAIRNEWSTNVFNYSPERWCEHRPNEHRGCTLSNYNVILDIQLPERPEHVFSECPWATLKTVTPSTSLERWTSLNAPLSFWCGSCSRPHCLTEILRKNKKRKSCLWWSVFVFFNIWKLAGSCHNETKTTVFWRSRREGKKRRKEQEEEEGREKIKNKDVCK